MNKLLNCNKQKEDKEIDYPVNLHEAIWITFFNPLYELLLISDLICRSRNE